MDNEGYAYQIPILEILLVWPSIGIKEFLFWNLTSTFWSMVIIPGFDY